jgi:hypothetical protein
MDRSRRFLLRCPRLGMIGALIVCGVSVWACKAKPQPTPAPSLQPLSANDISWLFPAPTQAADFANLIAVRDLTTQNLQDPTKRDPVWPDAVFQRFLAIAESPAVQVAGAPSIGLPAEAHSIDAWFVAGIRFDAGAPGLSNDIRAQFGQLPEIRLIIQPVTHNPDGSPKVADIAGHLIFNFTQTKLDDPAQTGCLQRPQPDLETFSKIVADLAALRTKLSEGGLGAHKITTAGAPLGVHPGLADATTASNLRAEMKSLLEKYIAGPRLQAMAIAGLPSGAPEPWIFLSIQEVPPGVDPPYPMVVLILCAARLWTERRSRSCYKQRERFHAWCQRRAQTISIRLPAKMRRCQPRMCPSLRAAAFRRLRSLPTRPWRRTRRRKFSIRSPIPAKATSSTPIASAATPKRASPWRI